MPFYGFSAIFDDCIISFDGFVSFYRRVYSFLSMDGVFCRAGIEPGESEFLAEVYPDEWKSFMRTYYGAAEEEKSWMVKESTPLLSSHSAWMHEAGFRGIDAARKHYNFQVRMGRK